MVDASPGGRNPIDAWSELMERTMKGMPPKHIPAGQGRGDGGDPWIAFIDKLWQANPYNALLPIDPAEITRTFQQLWLESMRHPDRAWASYSDFVQQSTQVMAASALKFWGTGKGAEPVIAPEAGDKRFSAPDWQQNPVFDALKQTYLLTATTLLKAAASIEGIDEKQQRKLVFYLRNTYLENNLVKPGKIVLKGIPIDLGQIRQDIYAVGTQQDHIVPWKSAWRVTQLATGQVRFVLGGSGHIAGIINPPGKGKGYWTTEETAKSADEWFETAESHKGSWWTDWLDWLKARSGEQSAPPPIGGTAHPPLTQAPGTYVLEK